MSGAPSRAPSEPESMPNNRKSTGTGPPRERSARPDRATPTDGVDGSQREVVGASTHRPTPPTPQDGQEAGRKPDQHPGAPVHPGVPLAPPGIVPESDVRLHTPAAAVPLPEHGLVNEGLGELPWAYGDGRLVSLVRDPTTLFVYWDFSPQQIDQAFAGLGPAKAVIRLWNTRSTNGELVRESEVHLDARGWYVRDLAAGMELRAELWAVGERGSRLMRAGRPIRLPPAQPSDQLETFYLKVTLDQPIAGGIPSGRPLNYGGSAPAGWERRLQPRSFSGSSFGGPFGSSPGGKLPWSMTHLMVPDPGDDE